VNLIGIFAIFSFKTTTYFIIKKIKLHEATHAKTKKETGIIYYPKFADNILKKSRNTKQSLGFHATTLTCSSRPTT
jgi:hypothetical protein